MKINIENGNTKIDIEQDEVQINKFSSKKQHLNCENKIDISQVFSAHQSFSNTDKVINTDLQQISQLSSQYDANIYLKRQDQQPGRTFKIRGAYNLYINSTEQQKRKGFVIPSDGNFALSYSIIANLYNVNFIIFVPECCYLYKIQGIKKQFQDVKIIQIGIDYQQCIIQATKYAQKNQMILILPNQNQLIMNGYATIAKQIMQSCKGIKINYILIPIGSGILASSIASFLKQTSPQVKILAVQPDNCTPFSTTILTNQIHIENKASRFCNGSSVRQSSQIAIKRGKTSIDGFIKVTENKIAQKMIRLYSYGFICQPSGALSITGLDKCRSLIKGKNVVCILSGANIDLTKLNQARQMNVMSKGYKNFYLIELPNRKQIIYELITKCFKQTDILSIQYIQKVNKQTSNALISIQSLTQDDVQYCIQKLKQNKYHFQNINDKQQLIDLFL